MVLQKLSVEQPGWLVPSSLPDMFTPQPMPGSGASPAGLCSLLHHLPPNCLLDAGDGVQIADSSDVISRSSVLQNVIF